MANPEHGEIVTAALDHIKAGTPATRAGYNARCIRPWPSESKQLIAPASWWWPTSAHVS
jgi:hypothetical protein